MLPWIKRWRAWAMPDFWSTHRPQPRALHYGYEKAGLTVYDQPIPWNAESVLVEAEMDLPPEGRRKGDFQVRWAGQAPVAAEAICRLEQEGSYRLVFRFRPPSRTTAAEFSWKDHRLGQLTLPVLEQETFVQGLRLVLPTLFVRLGDQSVACQTFVSTQCRGLMASALVTSTTSLVPLVDLGLQVEFRLERSGTRQSIPVQFSSSQLLDQKALVAVVPRRFPRRMGTVLATWLLGGNPLAMQRVRAISQRHFHRSLRVVDNRFVVRAGKGKVTLTRQLPPLEELSRAGPCFLVSSKEPGMAGLCPLQVHVQMENSALPHELPEQETLITDGPTMVAPGTLDAGDLAKVAGFELRLKGSLLGVMSTSPIPVASFTGEGGFKGLQDFAWSPAADEELDERLHRLFEDRAAGP
jgi:hypothetical protein